MTTDDAGSVAAADHRHAKLRVWAIRIGIGLVAILLLAVLAIAAAPVGWLKPRIETAITEYPYPNRYHVWPGPNSNTFVAFVLRKVPELRVDLPPTAIGTPISQLTSSCTA